MSLSSAEDHDESAPATNSGPEQPETAQELSPRFAPRRLHILSRDEAMAQLSNLSQMILCGIITVPQANSIRSNLNSIIQAHDRQSGSRELPVEQSTFIAERLRQFPEMANVLAGFLPSEIINRLMEGYGHE